MPNRYIIMLTITTIGMILACRVRNCDERFRRIVINGKIRNLFLFPVAVYNQTTIFSMVVCVSYEMLIGLAIFSIYLLNAKASTVCFFWGAFQIFFACVDIYSHPLAALKFRPFLKCGYSEYRISNEVHIFY